MTSKHIFNRVLFSLVIALIISLMIWDLKILFHPSHSPTNNYDIPPIPGTQTVRQNTVINPPSQKWNVVAFEHLVAQLKRKARIQGKNFFIARIKGDSFESFFRFLCKGEVFKIVNNVRDTCVYVAGSTGWLTVTALQGHFTKSGNLMLNCIGWCAVDLPFDARDQWISVDTVKPNYFNIFFIVDSVSFPGYQR